jgi:hypothetical protein
VPHEFETVSEHIRGTRRAVTASSGTRSYQESLRLIARENKWVVAIALGYIAAGGAVVSALHLPWPVELTNRWFAAVWVGATAAWMLLQWLRKGARHFARSFDSVRVGGALVVFLLVVPTQITFQSLKKSIVLTVGFPLDPALARADEILHGGPAWRLFAIALRYPTALRTLDWLYMLWFVALVAIVIWLSWTSRRALRAQALTSLLFVWIGGGTLAAWGLASAGPCYSPLPQYQELIARLDGVGFPLWARSNERGIWAAQQAHEWLAFGGVSAMPSMHVATAVWMAIVLWRRSRPMGVLFAAYAVLIQIGSVVLGWHYAIDGYAGAAIAWLAWSASRRLIQPEEPSALARPERRTREAHEAL